MASVFRLIGQLMGDHKCDGCAREIKKCVEELQGVESAKVKKRQDENGYDDFTLIVKGSFDPEKIIKEVERNKKKKIELVSSVNHGKVNKVEPSKVNVEQLKKLKQLASNNLGKAQLITELENECEALKAELKSARARQNELARQKRDILNRSRPNASIPQGSRGREPKKKDEYEVLYGKLASKEIKVEEFVQKYKKVQVKNYKQQLSTG